MPVFKVNEMRDEVSVKCHIVYMVGFSTCAKLLNATKVAANAGVTTW